MRLSYHLFRLLSLKAQLAVVWAEGRYLAQRWEGEDTVVLFALFYFFCELYYDAQANTILRTHCFEGRAGLEAYLPAIDLNELLLP